MKAAIAMVIKLQANNVWPQRQKALGHVLSAMDRIRKLLEKDRGTLYTNDFWSCNDMPYYNDEELNKVVLELVETLTQYSDGERCSTPLPWLYERLLDVFDKIGRLVT